MDYGFHIQQEEKEEGREGRLPGGVMFSMVACCSCAWVSALVIFALFKLV